MSEKTSDSSDQVQTKSPLQFIWTYWYLKQEKNVEWEKSLVKLIDLGFVEDFWATYNHLAAPSCLSTSKVNSEYYFFRKGIRPMWEEPENSNGGRWILTCGNDSKMLDSVWQETLLGMIGDCFSQDSDPEPLSKFITGCAALIRVRGHKITIWLSVADKSNIVREIGRRWKRILNLPESIRIQFEPHKEIKDQKVLYEE